MNIVVEKHAARKAAMAQRKGAHEAANGAGKVAAQHLLAWLETQPKLNTISGYMPIHTELDILPAMHALHEKGYALCVPVIMGKAMPLKFSTWTPDTKMVKGPFGAMVPECDSWQRPDLLLCPMLAFDGAFQRMGYGGGFYDRTIAALAPVRALGFAYAAQQVKTLPSEPTDMPLEGVFTEKGLFSP
ncbi:MAG TPA: 5-formyltetrahydrofolate cyclo-ligase [Rhodobacteraceae bacterium]|nr:5-formyltetrahydrofolate cyclo-ligase [Paracoccaceae bacterium]